MMMKELLTAMKNMMMTKEMLTVMKNMKMNIEMKQCKMRTMKILTTYILKIEESLRLSSRQRPFLFRRTYTSSSNSDTSDDENENEQQESSKAGPSNQQLLQPTICEK